MDLVKLKIKSKSIYNNILKVIFFGGVAAALTTCSKPDGDPGTCELKCDGALIGGSELSFESVYGIESASCPDVNYGNASYLAVDAPITLQFRAYKNTTVNGVTKKIPIGGISFQPLVGGILDPNKTNESNKTDSGIYSGIVTPKSDWCTDSCGVGTITIQPVCLKGNDNDISVLLRSGSLYSDTVKFAFKAPAEE